MSALAADTALRRLPAVLPALDPAGYQPHALHAAERNWPETNCSVDLWIELLASIGVAPEAALGFTVTQEFEGDQFTFFKIPPEDLESLYGIRLGELAIYDLPERHAHEQVTRGRIVLMEVDSFFLPDTRGVSYRSEHGKTSIGINRIDLEGARLEYFHNGGYHVLDGDDFTGVFEMDRRTDERPFLPYTEFAKLPAAAVTEGLAEAAAASLRRHMGRRPGSNPIRDYRERIGEQATALYDRPAFFHKYAFNTLRQLGANFELLGSMIDWLSANGIETPSAAAEKAFGIAAGAKTVQFQLARAIARKRADSLPAALDPLAEFWDHLMDELDSRFG